MHRYFIKLAYDGTPYNGWQIQKNAPSVQAVINEALTQLCRESINVVGCGRTDTGVHARVFYAHFDLSNPLEDLLGLVRNLNHYLPKSIVIFNIFPVSPDAHARFDAILRTYRYYILRSKDPFKQAFSYFYHGPLDISIMNEGAELMQNFHDFTSFSKVKTQTKTNLCQIKEAYWTIEDNLLVFTISADRFLRNMVRAIVGTLLDMGKHKITLDELSAIIEHKNRAEAGYSVPAKGLFLENVIYPDVINAQK
ncbi:MAG: tRNA pseudouridine(38-40) synthase TruA [Bacteroidetes bacterium]|nr:tRNA pseudouridine(38-40) synthase TruA [Bacteroidota bacterium]